MKKLTITLTTIFTILMFVTSLGFAQEPSEETNHTIINPSPKTVYDAIQAARLSGDIDTAMTHYADNAVFIAFPPPPDSDGIFVGKDAIQAVMEELHARNLTYAYTDFQTHGNKAAVTAKVSEDVFAGVGIDSLTFNGTSILDDGLVIIETWMMEAESQLRFGEAMTIAANEALFDRFLVELWYQNDFDAVDEILSDDFVSHAFPEGNSDILIEAIKGFRNDLPDGYFIIDELTVTTDKIVALGSAVATPPATGDEPERLDRFILTLSVVDGKIADRWVAFVP
ncbi:MAG: nuclear transport factor 2 family protein [Chloroflexota bacterium]